MLVQGKDGELRLFDQGLSGNTYYLEILFTSMDFSGPTSRPRIEEMLIMDRGIFDSHAHYVTGNDEPRYASFPISFSCRLADTINSRVLSDWISGVTKVAGTTQLYSTKGKTTIDGNTLPTFVDTTGKITFHLEMLWCGQGGNTVGYGYKEVYFTPGQQNISESADGLTLTCSGLVYGDVTRITGFTAGLVSVI